MTGFEEGVNGWLRRAEEERVVMGGEKGIRGGRNERGGEGRRWQGEP